MREFPRDMAFTVALALASLVILTDAASAKPKGDDGNKGACAKLNGMYTVENSGATSCVLISEGLSRNCSASGECAVVDTRRPDGTPSNGPRGDGKGWDDGKGTVVADDPNKGWNGQYTTVVVTDGRGTSTYTVKQGVPIENGQKILAPNGVSYNTWDPELAKQLKAAGVDKAYANPKAAQNEYNLANDKRIRELAAKRIATGEKNVTIPSPAGHRNLDALGNRAPVINDHRGDKATTSKSSDLPPAAAPGTVVAAPSPASDSSVRDHRHPTGTSTEKSGGVTVSQASKTEKNANSNVRANAGDDRKKH
jgi:hypothetical protein